MKTAPKFTSMTSPARPGRVQTTKASVFKSILGCSVMLALIPNALQAGWKDYEEADVILGRKTLPSPSSTLGPYDVAVSAGGKVYVADYGHHRVLRFASAAALGIGQPAEAVFGQPDLFTAEPNLNNTGMTGPVAVEVDSAGNLWVADTENHRILRWANADTAASGSQAAQVLGQATFSTKAQGFTASGLSRPSGIDVDGQGRLWVADYSNNRVLRYDNAVGKANGGAADGVLGQTGFGLNGGGLSQNQMLGVSDVCADSQGRLWVADSFNRRILRFDNPVGSPSPNGVLGQPDYLSNIEADAPGRLGMTLGVAVAPNGSVFAADASNSRILRWDNAATKANGASADGVLGRIGLSPGSPVTAIGGSVAGALRGIHVDATGRLWAVDRDNERVLHWANAASKAAGAVADGIIGQSGLNVTVHNSVVPAAGVTTAFGGYEDPASGKFFIADRGRVLRYSSRSAAESGQAPEAFLGKSDAITTGGNASATSLSSAWGIVMDDSGKLWVADVNAHRVVAFANAVTATTGSSISVSLGQNSLSGTAAATAANRLKNPRGLALDAAGNLYVCDYGNHRVLRFNNVKSRQTNDNADAVIGQADFVSASTLANSALLNSPSGVAVDVQGRLWIADSGKNRVVRYDSPLAMAPTAAPDGSLGGFATVTATGMNQPTAVAVTPNGRLWVCDYSFNRILRFENAASKANGAAADGVLGQPNLTTHQMDTRTRRGFSKPQSLFLDAAGKLWVCDDINYRIMKFVPDPSATIVSTAVNGSGHFTFNYKGLANVPYEIRSSTNLKDWELEQQLVLPDTNIKTFTSLKSAPRFFRIVEP